MTNLHTLDTHSHTQVFKRSFKYCVAKTLNFIAGTLLNFSLLMLKKCI